MKLSWALATDQPVVGAFWADDQGLRYEPHPSHRHQAARPDDAINRGTLDVGDAFAPDLVWRIVGNYLLTGEYRGLESWRALMRERSQLTGGTYCPQPQAWLGSDQHTRRVVGVSRGQGMS